MAIQQKAASWLLLPWPLVFSSIHSAMPNSMKAIKPRQPVPPPS